MQDYYVLDSFGINSSRNEGIINEVRLLLFSKTYVFM